MSKKVVAKAKKVGLSNAGQQLANAKDSSDLAFDQIKNLVFLAKSLKPWKEDPSLGLYIRLIMATIRQKGPDRKKYVSDHCNPYTELYESFKPSILDEDMGFLLEKEVILKVGKQRNGVGACINLTGVYKWCMDNNENDTATDVEAKLYHIFKNLCNNSAEKDRLKTICENFELEEDQSMQNAIGSIVKKVQGTVNNVGDGTPSIESLTPLIQALIGDPEIHGAMGSLAQNLMNGKTDIKGLVDNVKKSVIDQNVEEQTEQEAQEEAQEDE